MCVGGLPMCMFVCIYVCLWCMCGLLVCVGWWGVICGLLLSLWVCVCNFGFKLLFLICPCGWVWDFLNIYGVCVHICILVSAYCAGSVGVYGACHMCVCEFDLKGCKQKNNNIMQK